MSKSKPKEYTRDKIHQIVQPGDTVCYNPPRYKGISIGTVIRTTPKGVTVQSNQPGNKSQCNRSSGDVVKINLQMEHTRSENAEFFI